MDAADFARVEQSLENGEKVHRGAIPAGDADYKHLEQNHAKQNIRRSVGSDRCGAASAAHTW